MSSDASRREILAAREERDRLVLGLCAQVPGTLVLVGTNIPGPDKDRPGLADLIDLGVALLGGEIRGGDTLLVGTDRLGPFRAEGFPETPMVVKRAAVRVEETLPGGRLLDIDVYDGKGRAIDRASLDLPPRRCLVCMEPARECILLLRHTPEELEEAVRGQIALARSR